MADFSVPRWLEPPNEVERQRMDEATAAAQERAGVMMRRAIGMRRMQADAQEAIQSGVDPITAKQNALLNNAHLLFSDNPQAVASIVNHEEANQVRERANLQLNQHREIQDVLRGQLNKITQERNEQAAKHASDMLDARNRELDLKAEVQDQKAQKQEISPEIRVLTDPDTGEKLSVLRTGPNSWTTTERKAGKVDELQKLHLSSLYSELRTANHDLSTLGAPTAKDAEETIAARTELVNRKAQIQKQINLIESKSKGTAKPQAATPTTPTEPKPKPTLELKVGKKYRDAEGNIKVYKGADKDGNPIWEDWEG